MAEEVVITAGETEAGTLPIARVQMIDKDTGAATDVDLHTCARGVTCDENKTLQQHLVEIHGHMEDDTVHLTAEEKNGLETTTGAQAKADAALAAAKTYADAQDVKVLTAAGQAADTKIAAALVEAATDAATKANTAKNEAIAAATADAASKVTAGITEHNGKLDAHPDIRQSMTATGANLEAHKTDPAAHSGVLAPMYTYSQTDITAGTTPLETGKLYLVFE